MVWLAGDWEKEDFNLGAARGDPAWQSEWELHAALLAIDTWLPRLRGQPLCLFQSDSTATLYAVMHASGKTPAMNALAAEIALRLESLYAVMHHECARSGDRFATRAPVCSHACFRQNSSHECARSGDRFATRVCQRLHSTRARGVALNFDCDALSRLSEGAQLPAILGNVRRDVPKPRQPGFFWGWPATLLFGCQRQSSACGLGASGKRVRTALQSLARQSAQRLSRAKLKGKGKGDQVQQPGVHAGTSRQRTRRPVDFGNFLVQRRPLLLTTLLFHRVRSLVQHPRVPQHFGLQMLL